MSTISKLYPLLKKTGLNETETQEFIEILESPFTQNLATKEDLKETENRLIKCVIGLLFAQTGIIIAIIKLL